MTPNHALQRTGSAVTAPAALHLHLSAHRQVPRPLRLSLSLGSFGVARVMLKIALLLIFAFDTVALAAERRFESGLSGHVTIVKATYWWDGGSVSVALRDEHGTEARCRYTNNWLHDAAEHGGQFSFAPPKVTKATYFRRHGSYEKSLISLLQIASVATFGTADPKQLEKAGKAGDWNQLAMAALFSEAASPRVPNTFR